MTSACQFFSMLAGTNNFKETKSKMFKNKMIYLFQILFFYQIQLNPWNFSTANRLARSSTTKSKEEFTPYFSKPIENATAVLGRSAVLECSVENLGPYNKVAWLKMDSSNSESTVLTIGMDTLFGERKYRVTQNGDRQWFLHIKHVRVSDRGNYMCQVNAKNMIAQVGHLDVQVPPILIEDRTSSDTTVDEHQKAVLKCTAKGYPKPKITWRREDGQPINLGLFGGQKYAVQTFEGSQLNLTQVTREDMGAYLCIASNGVPPSLSRRILLHVNFRPKIRVQNQLISSRVGSRVELVCMCEAYPRPMVTWITPSEQPVLGNNPLLAGTTIGPGPSLSWSSNNANNNNQTSLLKRYEAKEEYQGYRVTMRLIINYLTKEDFGGFKCIAKNTLGEKEGLIRVYENQSKHDLPVRRFNNNVNALKSRKSLSKESSSNKSSTRNSGTTNPDGMDVDSFVDDDGDDDFDDNFQQHYDSTGEGKYYNKPVELSNGVGHNSIWLGVPGSLGITLLPWLWTFILL